MQEGIPSRTTKKKEGERFLRKKSSHDAKGGENYNFCYILYIFFPNDITSAKNN